MNGTNYCVVFSASLLLRELIMLLPRSVILYLIPLEGGPSITKKPSKSLFKYIYKCLILEKFPIVLKNQIYYFCNVKFRL